MFVELICHGVFKKIGNHKLDENAKRLKNSFERTYEIWNIPQNPDSSLEYAVFFSIILEYYYLCISSVRKLCLKR